MQWSFGIDHKSISVLRTHLPMTYCHSSLWPNLNPTPVFSLPTVNFTLIKGSVLVLMPLFKFSVAVEVVIGIVPKLQLTQDSFASIIRILIRLLLDNLHHAIEKMTDVLRSFFLYLDIWLNVCFLIYRLNFCFLNVTLWNHILLEIVLSSDYFWWGFNCKLIPPKEFTVLISACKSLLLLRINNLVMSDDVHIVDSFDVF